MRALCVLDRPASHSVCTHARVQLLRHRMRVVGALLLEKKQLERRRLVVKAKRANKHFNPTEDVGNYA